MSGSLTLLIASALLFVAPHANGDPLPVRYSEGRIHGFLVLRNTSGEILASGDLVQSVEGNNVTTQLTFHFKDGSMHREKTVFSQQGTFRLLTYHLTQTGRTFPRPTDMFVNAATGDVTVKYREDGKQKIKQDHLDIPADLANGIVSTLLADVDPKAPKTTLSMIVSTPDPRLVKLDIEPAADSSFTNHGSSSKALHYVVNIDIGGLTGVIASLIGKQPPPTDVWMVGGDVPGFLKSKGPLFQDGPIWIIELAAPAVSSPTPTE